MPQVREFEIPRQLSRWKRCLQVYSRCFILYRDYSNSLTLSKVGELSWGCSRVVTPQGKEMFKKIIKKGNAWANSGIAFVLSVLFAARGEMISLNSPSTVFCIFGCIFHMGVVLDTGIWGLWSKNEPSEISKGDQKRIKWVYLAILFQIYTSVLNT